MLWMIRRNRPAKPNFQICKSVSLGTMKNVIIFGSFFLIAGWVVYGFFKNTESDELFEVMQVPSFELTDQDGNTVTDKDMLGKVYVVEFFFTNCPTICPVMNENLIEVEADVNNPDLGIISITIDPKRDTPEVLKEYKDSHGITNPNWHFVTGDRDYILALSKQFNIYMDENDDAIEGLDHSGRMAVIDKNGKIRSRYSDQGVPILYYSGLNYKDEEGKEPDLRGEFHPQINRMKEDIQKLLAE